MRKHASKQMRKNRVVCLAAKCEEEIVAEQFGPKTQQGLT
jgi:hypothetical protein